MDYIYIESFNSQASCILPYFMEIILGKWIHELINLQLICVLPDFLLISHPVQKHKYFQ